MRTLYLLCGCLLTEFNFVSWSICEWTLSVLLIPVFRHCIVKSRAYHNNRLSLGSGGIADMDSWVCDYDCKMDRQYSTQLDERTDSDFWLLKYEIFPLLISLFIDSLLKHSLQGNRDLWVIDPNMGMLTHKNRATPSLDHVIWMLLIVCKIRILWLLWLFSCFVRLLVCWWCPPLSFLAKESWIDRTGIQSISEFTWTRQRTRAATYCCRALRFVSHALMFNWTVTTNSVHTLCIIPLA